MSLGRGRGSSPTRPARCCGACRARAGVGCRGHLPCPAGSRCLCLLDHARQNARRGRRARWAGALQGRSWPGNLGLGRRGGHISVETGVGRRGRQNLCWANRGGIRGSASARSLLRILHVLDFVFLVHPVAATLLDAPLRIERAVLTSSACVHVRGRASEGLLGACPSQGLAVPVQWRLPFAPVPGT